MPTISVKYEECLILSSAGLQGGGANKGKVIRKMFSGVNAEDLIKGQGWKCEKRGNLRGVSNNIDGRDGVSKYNGKISFEVYPHLITTISSPLGMFVKIFLHSLSLLLLSTWWITTIENTGKNFKGNPLKTVSIY